MKPRPIEAISTTRAITVEEYRCSRKKKYSEGSADQQVTRLKTTKNNGGKKKQLQLKKYKCPTCGWFHIGHDRSK